MKNAIRKDETCTVSWINPCLSETFKEKSEYNSYIPKLQSEIIELFNENREVLVWIRVWLDVDLFYTNGSKSIEISSCTSSDFVFFIKNHSTIPVNHQGYFCLQSSLGSEKCDVQWVQKSLQHLHYTPGFIFIAEKLKRESVICTKMFIKSL